MNVLVIYASPHGSTRGIADRIAERLRGRGHDAVAAAFEQVRDIDVYDALVIGSAIHDQRWMPEARAFVERHRGVLSDRRVWLFSVSSVGDEESFFPSVVAGMMRRARGDLPDVASARAATDARGHRHFAGAIERGHYPLAGHMFMKAMGGRYGDHRNWAAIDAWAEEIATALGAPGL